MLTLRIKTRLEFCIIYFQNIPNFVQHEYDHTGMLTLSVKSYACMYAFQTLMRSVFRSWEKFTLILSPQLSRCLFSSHMREEQK